jgi:hypothetical protein
MSLPRSNASFFPSGDQFGESPFRTTSRCPRPFRLTVQMFGVRTKEIVRPVGDQAGLLPFRADQLTGVAPVSIHYQTGIALTTLIDDAAITT